MSQVYIILAHKNPDQLGRMVQRLRYDDIKFVIHVDAKCDVEEFKKQIHLCNPDVSFLANSVATNWASFALVEACLNAFQFVVENIPDAERVTLLSGQDYPIKPARDIFRFFDNNKEKIYISYFPIPNKHWNNGGKNRFPNFSEISEMITIYAGSQWWSFPMRLVRRLLTDLKDYADFITYFEHVFIPDESFFQTLLLNYEDKEIHDNLVNENLRHMSWRPPYRHPKTLMKKDFLEIIESNKLFARKFDITIDDNVLGEIDSFLLSNSLHPALSEAKKPSLAILLLSNKPSSLQYYKKLQKEVPENAKAFLMYHLNNDNILNNEHVEGVNLYHFGNEVLTNLGFTSLTANLVPGSNHFPLFSFFNKFPEFDYYWVIEDDVYFNGNWGLFFESFSPENNDSDLLSSCVRFYEQEPGWHWWNTLTHPNSRTEKEISTRVASFNPIYRLSREALLYLKEKLTSGWVGHHEVLIPTLLYNAGFSIMDFGGDGVFCSKENRHKYYKQLFCDVRNHSHFSSMRYRPLISPSELTEEILYHPVKWNVSEQNL